MEELIGRTTALFAVPFAAGALQNEAKADSDTIMIPGTWLGVSPLYKLAMDLVVVYVIGMVIFAGLISSDCFAILQTR